jgi:hypothetical protein
MGEAGLARAYAEFTWRGVGESLAQIYAQLARATDVAPTEAVVGQMEMPRRAAAGASSG